jgi:hypothetical protein
MDAADFHPLKRRRGLEITRAVAIHVALAVDPYTGRRR